MKRVYVKLIKEYKITLLAYLLIETIFLKDFLAREKIPSDNTHSWYRIATIDDTN